MAVNNLKKLRDARLREVADDLEFNITIEDGTLTKIEVEGLGGEVYRISVENNYSNALQIQEIMDYEIEKRWRVEYQVAGETKIEWLLDDDKGSDRRRRLSDQFYQGHNNKYVEQLLTVRVRKDGGVTALENGDSLHSLPDAAFDDNPF